MKRTTGWLLAAGVLATLGFYARAAAPPDGARAAVLVSVAVTGCDQDAISITINPWQAHVRAQDDLAWTHSGVDSLAISPVTPGWPFQNANPRAARGAQASAGALARGRARAGQKYSYEIVMWCGGHEIHIDPDIIIDE